MLGHASGRVFALPGVLRHVARGSVSWPHRTSLQHAQASWLPSFFPPRFASFCISGSEFSTPPPPVVFFKRIHSSAVAAEPSTPFLPLKAPLQFPQRSSSFFHTSVLLEGGGNYSRRQAGTLCISNPHKSNFSCGKIHESL